MASSVVSLRAGWPQQLFDQTNGHVFFHVASLLHEHHAVGIKEEHRKSPVERGAGGVDGGFRSGAKYLVSTVYQDNVFFLRGHVTSLAYLSKGW